LGFATVHQVATMRSVIRFPALFLAAALATAFAATAHANIVINIDKSTQSMTVSVDGTQQYVWTVSTGRAGYDTPNGTFKPNRMDADHLSQEWDNAPMPHAIFFDLNGHAIHGFFDVKHLGLPVSHGCVRLSPDHAATLFALVKAEGMAQTSVVVSGRIPANGSPEMVRRQPPVQQTSAEPMPIAPPYGQQQPQPNYGEPQGGYAQQPPPYGQPEPQPYYEQQQQPYYGQQRYYGQQPQTYYRQPIYSQPAYQQPQFFPAQPPPVRY